VRSLLARSDVALDSKNGFGRTPLSQAAEQGYEAVARLVLGRDDVEADSKDQVGRTSLSQAAEPDIRM